MKYTYITTPPELAFDLPDFLAKKYGFFDKKFIEELIAWSIREYYDAIIYFHSTGDDHLAEILSSRKYSHLDFLSHTKQFELIYKYMTSEIWSTLNKDVRNTLIRAMNKMTEKN